ncbi:MAG: response regulator transcription factor, partial [Gemmatimonadota bacterium]
LVRAIRVTGRDEAFLSTAGTSILVHAFQVVGEEPPAGPLDALSSREREVLTLTAEGYSASEVGQRLFLSPKTVETYRSRLMHKLGLNHRAELVHFAISRHLLDDAPAESAPVRPRQHARPPS